jgi:hypothetical protein
MSWYPVWRTEGLIDAAAFRTGAQLLGKPGLYDAQVIGALEAPYAPYGAEQACGQTCFGAQAVRVVLRFPSYLLALKWMTAMPYSTAMGIWKVVLVVACVAFVLVWPDRGRAALAICWSLASMAAIPGGQDTPVFLLCLGAAIQLLRRDWDVLAGIILSVCTIKPQLLVFVPLLFVFQRRFRFAAGFLAGCGAQLLISFLVQGSSWLKEYLMQLSHPGVHSAWVYMPSVAGLLASLHFRYRGLACVAAAVLLLPVLLRICRNQSASICLGCCVAAALIVAPHAFINDVALLIPLCLSVTPFGSLRSLALWLMSPVAVYPLLLAGRYNNLPLEVLGAAFVVFPVLVLLVRIRNRSLEKERELSPAPLQTYAVEPPAGMSGVN